MNQTKFLSGSELDQLKAVATKARGTLPATAGICSAERMLTLVTQVRSVTRTKPAQPAELETVARAICKACGEKPDHKGDARGREFRWQDYLDVAEAAVGALTLPDNIDLDKIEASAKAARGTVAEKMALCSPDTILILASFAARANQDAAAAAAEREAVARAICQACDDDPDGKAAKPGLDFWWQVYLEPADAALSALKLPAPARQAGVTKTKKAP